jgi:hypothetical protein
MWCFEIAVDGQTYEIRVPKREGDVEEKVLLAALRRENEAVAGLAIWKKDAATSEQVAVPAKEEGGGIQVNPDGAPDNLPPIPTDVLGSELAISDTDAPNDTVTIGGKPYKVTLEITTPPANTRIKLAPVEQTGENQPPSYTLELQQDNAWKVVSPPPAA